MASIKWTRDEAVAFLEKAVEEFRTHPNSTRRAVIDAAMLKVPGSRRRHIASLNQIEAEGWTPPADVAHFFGVAPKLDKDGLPPIPDASLPLTERQSMMARRIAALKKQKLQGKKEVRVFWSEGERKQVVAEAARIIFESEGPEAIHLSDAVRQAQSVLPPSRRRTLPQVPSDLNNALRAELDRLRENARKAPPPPQPKVEDMRLNLDVGDDPQPVEEHEARAPADEPELPQAAYRPEPPPSATAGALDAIADAFGRWASRYLAKILLGAVKEVLTDPSVGTLMQAIKATPEETSSLLRLIASGPARPAHRHNPEPQSAPKERKPVVLVCGVQPEFQEQFLKTFPALQLKFWFQQDGSSGLEPLRQKAQFCDVAIFRRENTWSHKQTEILKAMGKRWVMVSGGIDAVIEAVRIEQGRLLASQKAVA